MVYQLLREAILRHFRETRLIIEQLKDSMILAEPVESGRPLGEIILHMLRSIEYYLQGLTRGVWAPLPYQLSTYGTAASIQALYDEVVAKAEGYLEQFDPLTLQNVIERFNRPATKVEILLEMLEHSVQHRGQILVYYRLLGIEPAGIPYIL